MDITDIALIAFVVVVMVDALVLAIDGILWLHGLKTLTELSREYISLGVLLLLWQVLTPVTLALHFYAIPRTN